MPSIRASLARSRSTRLDKQQQQPSKHHAGAATTAKGRKAQPPFKRRRILHHSSTGTSDSSSDSAIDDEDEAASSARDTDQSSEHDDVARDSDYVNENSEEDQTTPRAQRHYHRHAMLASSSDASMSESEASSSSSGDGLSPVKKALSPIEVNALNRGRRGARKASAPSQSLQKQAKVAARKLRRDAPVIHALNRFPPSPAKLLPTTTATRRGFQVRPDLPNPFSLNLPSNSASSSSTAARHRANGARATATIQAGFRRFAGKMIQRVNTMGLSGSAKKSSAAIVPLPPKPSDNLSSSLNGKRKRDDRGRDYPRANKSDHSSSRRSSADAKSLKRNSAQHAGETVQEKDFSSFQPLRRTRSLARQIEQLGIPPSQTYDDTDEDDEDVPFASTSATSSRRISGKTKMRATSETDDDTESVERSIAEMSLDEITENGEEEDDEEEPGEDAEEAQEDAYLLNEASVPRLHRLRKDELLRLVAGLQHEDDEQDRSDFTKDMLVKMILDNREVQAEEAEEAEDQDEIEEDVQDSSDASEEQGQTQKKKTAEVLTTRHATRSNSNSKTKSPKHASKSLPTSSSPRRSSHAVARSRSYSHTFDSSSSASSSSDNEEQASSQQSSPRQQRRRRTASGVGLGRPKSSSQTEKTPGRLRSGKLRQPSTVLSSSDAEKENRFHGHHTVPALRRTASRATVEDEDDDAPTPIARRTRHRRNLSTASAASSAGYGDDEEVDGMAHREYRLKKISLPRRQAAKKGSVIEVSEDDEEEEDQLATTEDEDVDEGSVIDHGEEADEDEEEEEHDDPIDLSSATKTSLLRLRRDVLVQMCLERDIEDAGTKSDLATALLDWQAEHRHADSEGDADQSEQSASSEQEDDEDDEDFQPADVSMETVSSATSVESSSTVISDATTRVARKETKTQALAKLSNKRQSYDEESREKPLLLKSPRSKAQVVHSPRPDTPPGSGDAQDNDLELDLESLNLLDKEIHPDKLKRGEKIGSGGFKDVYEGKYRNVKVALADIRGHLTENDIKELGLLRDLRHENIVRFIGVSIPEQKDVPVTIVTELCSNGDLFDYIRNTPAPPLEKILSIMLNIAKGLEYLHKRKPATIHRDMKSSNVLVTARGVAKIADFGLARVRNSTRSIIKSLVGTVNWQAPELWVPHPRYNEKVDVYSAAMVFWECLQWHLTQKRYPFEGMNEHAIYQEVGQKQMRPSTATMRRQWGGEILDLVERMWAQAPSQRPTMPEVVKELESMLHAEKARARAAR